MNVLMPETANLVKWLKSEGEHVQRGDILLEIETDKTVLQVEAEVDGLLQSILVPEGTAAVPAHSPVARLVAAGEAEPAPAAATAAAVIAAAAGGAPAAAAVVAGGAPDAAASNGRRFSSPLARRLAREAGVELASVTGSGPGGRIVERDIKRALEQRAAGAPALSALAPAPLPLASASAEAVKQLFPANPWEEVTLDGMRSTIAQRLQAAKQTVPHFYLRMDVELDAVLALRRELNAGAPRGDDGAPRYKLTLNDFVVRALALALQRVPQANAVWAGDRILRFQRSDVGVAVAVDDGLYTPVLRGAESKTLSAISNEMKALAEKARQRRLRSEEYQGGTTAVSNLGMHGVQEFAAIINPPHATMLAVGEAGERIVARSGAPVVVQAMTVTLSCDHRVVDGALGARLLKEFKALLQQPMNLLV